MNRITVPRLRAEAKKQLLSYRRNNARAYKNEAQRAERANQIGWKRAIDEARAYLCAVNPTKERFMCRLFGLETPVPRSRSMRERMIKLGMELTVSESTLYKWREDILEIVLYAAIEAGLITPFGIRAEAKPETESTETKPKRKKANN